MLQAMREGAGAKVIKIALMSFLVMAVAGLVLSDVGGFFRGGGVPANAVAKGAGVNISAQEFDQTVRRVLARENISPAEAFQRGIVHNILRSEIERQLINRRSQQLGLHTSDDVVTLQMGKIAQQIAPAGGGSRADQLKQILRAQGITESEFIQSVREETASSILRSALASTGMIIPAALTADIAMAEGQTRNIRTITLKNDTITGYEEPDEESLQKFYEANKVRFAIPGTRTITVATLNRATLEDKLNITDEDVRAEYDEHIDVYTKPAQQVAHTASFASEEEAQKAIDAVKAGKTMKQAAGDKFLGDGPFQPNALTPEINDAVEAAKDGDIVGPVKTALGYYAAAIKTQPAEVMPFDNVKKSIREEMVQSRLMDDLLAAGNEMDDRLAAGDKLEDIVKDMGLTTQKIGPFRQNGADASGKDLFKDYASDKGEIVDAAFTLRTGEAAPVIETADGRFLAVRADEATETDYKSYDSVKAELKNIWIAEQKKLLNQTRARDAHTKLQNGAKLDDLAKELGVQVQSYNKVTRDGDAPKGLGPVAVVRLFQVGQNDFILAEQEDGISIAAVTAIDFPAPAKAQDDAMAKTLQTEMANETLALYINDLAKDGAVKINEKLLQQMYAQAAPSGF